MKKAILLCAVSLLCVQLSFANQARVSSVTGTADVKAVKSESWYTAQKGAMVQTGQKIKTKARSRVKLDLADGSKMEIYPNSQVDLDNLKAGGPSFKMKLGRLKAWVSKNLNRTKFEVHTPVAVCSVRGTEFTVDVDRDGNTDIEVLKGIVGVRRIDGLGEDVPVGAGERLRVLPEGPLTPDMKSEAGALQRNVRREVGLEMSKEEVMSAAAAEMRLAEYQEGKTMIDVSGSRVRLEEYIMRPAADAFKLVVLNEREDRFDYFYYKGTFNKDLPGDLTVALRDMGGKLGTTAPEYYLTSYEQAYSNTRDSSKDNASGGHLVKVTCNANGTFTLTDAADAANTRTVNAYDATNGAYDPIADTFNTSRTSALDLTVFNPASDAYQSFAAGQTYWRTSFNSYQHALDNVVKQRFLPSSASKNILAGNLDGHWVYPSLDSSGSTIYGEWGVSASGSSYPDSGALHNRIRIDYRDNTFEQYDTYILSDDGKIASPASFNAITTGSGYKSELLKWNYEQVITATEFGGRKIDLVVEPKILIKSGIIK